MAALLDAFTAVCVAAGLFFLLAGTAGLLRFPDAASRLHALTKVDALGLGLIVLGLLPRAEGVAGALKLLLVWGLVVLSGAVVGQLLARRATEAEAPPP
jgi:multicomponent Na+:H+ antiporter subunit G